MDINVNDTTCNINELNDASAMYARAGQYTHDTGSIKGNPFADDAARLDVIAFKGARSAFLVCFGCGKCINVPMNARGEHTSCEGDASRGVYVRVSSRDAHKIDS